MSEPLYFLNFCFVRKTYADDQLIWLGFELSYKNCAFDHLVTVRYNFNLLFVFCAIKNYLKHLFAAGVKL